MQKLFIGVVLVIFPMVAQAQCVSLLDPEWKLHAVGSHNKRVLRVGNDASNAALVYEDGAVEIIHWETPDQYTSTFFSQADMISPNVAPVAMPMDDGVAMDEKYIAVAYTTTGHQKLVNIFRKDASGIYEFLTRKTIGPNLVESFITDVAITPKRPDGSRFLFVTWFANSIQSGVTVFRLDDGPEGNGVVTVATVEWPCKLLQRMETFRGVADPNHALVVMSQVDFEIGQTWPNVGVCDGAKDNFRHTLFGLTNDGAFITRSAINAVQRNFANLTSMGEMVASHHEGDDVRMMQIFLNFANNYEFINRYTYNPTNHYCDIAPDANYRTPIMLGNQGQYMAEIFTGAPSRITARSSSSPYEYESIFDVDLEGAVMVSAYNAFFCHAFSASRNVYITLPYGVESTNARAASEEPIQAQENPSNPEGPVYPNPASDILNMNMPEMVGDGLADIVSATGDVVFKMKIPPGVAQINIADLQPGVYKLVLRYQSKDGLPKQVTQSFFKK